MSVLRSLAPAKVNLGLFLGPRRRLDGRHELATVMQSVSLADELELEPGPAGAGRDEIVCAGVPGDPEDNLAARALAAFRERTGWEAPPLRLRIIKRIPVAGGLGGGSADAGAALRLAASASGLGDAATLHELAAGLGADVPAQVSPGRWLAWGAGEELARLPDPGATFELLVLPLAGGLSTAAVYEEADRLGLQRDEHEIAGLREQLGSALAHGAPLPAASELLHNDLQHAAVSLCPPIAEALSEAREAGAPLAIVSGSGPTVLGLFPRAGDGSQGASSPAARAAARLAGRTPAALVASAADRRFAGPAPAGEPLRRPTDGAVRNNHA
jgi:4-diphosphocytidyl-2-C-methyl-D-erythritol kinase